MKKLTISRTGFGIALVLSIAPIGLSEDIITDGNFDALSVGSAPDNDTPNGAWHVASQVGESGDDTITVVETSSFDPAAAGHSLSLSRPAVLGHRSGVENQFNRLISENDREIVRARFRLFIPNTTTPDRPSAAFFIGGNHGDLTFPSSGQEDRGPQLSWDRNGMLAVSQCDSHSQPCRGFSYHAITQTPLDVWQQIQLDIDLAADTYDLFWSAGGDELELVAPYLRFRSGRQEYLDRFTAAFFSGRDDPNYPEGNVYLDDLDIAILKKDWIGDANLDGEFNSGDLVGVFAANKFDTGETAAWSQGDWNGDRRFNSSDLVAAFQDGGYEMGPRHVVGAVPEPSSWILLSLGLLSIVRIGNR